MWVLGLFSWGSVSVPSGFGQAKWRKGEGSLQGSAAVAWKALCVSSPQERCGGSRHCHQRLVKNPGSKFPGRFFPPKTLTKWKENKLKNELLHTWGIPSSHGASWEPRKQLESEAVGCCGTWSWCLCYPGASPLACTPFGN